MTNDDHVELRLCCSNFFKTHFVKIGRFVKVGPFLPVACVQISKGAFLSWHDHSFMGSGQKSKYEEMEQGSHPHMYLFEALELLRNHLYQGKISFM